MGWRRRIIYYVLTMVVSRTTTLLGIARPNFFVAKYQPNSLQDTKYQNFF